MTTTSTEVAEPVPTAPPQEAPAEAPGPSVGLGVLFLALAVVFWGFPGIFMKHFSTRLDLWTQNLCRYGFATAGLWGVCLALFRADALAAARRWKAFLLPTLFNCLFQVSLVGSLYHESIYPGFTSLVTRSSVLFATGLAFLFFREERGIIFSPLYLSGMTLGIVGVAGVILFGGGEVGADFGIGAAMALAAALCWACYTVSMKGVLGKTSPVAGFTVVATFTTGFFVAMAFWRGNPGQFLELAPPDMMWLIVSGLVCISVAHTLYFQAVRTLGVAVCASFGLVGPLLTNAASAVIFGERLAPAQMLAGTLLLLGVYLTVRSRYRARNGAVPV